MSDSSDERKSPPGISSGGMLAWIGERAADFILVGLMAVLLMIVVVALYGVPPEMKGGVTAIAFIFLALLIAGITVLAFKDRLQFKMGMRNMVRHRSDSLIAVLGFMIGTSIICSSMAIGDTMANMVEGLVYDSYHLYDEVISIQDEAGEPVYFNGSQANALDGIVWSLNDGGTELIDGVSWEVRETGAVLDYSTVLFEPAMSLRAVSEGSMEAFGHFTSDGSRIEYDPGPDGVYLVKGAASKLDAKVGDALNITGRGGSGMFFVKAVLDESGRAKTFSFDGSTIFMSFEGIWSLSNVTTDGATPNGEGGSWDNGFYNTLVISNKGGVVGGGELCPEVIEGLEEALKDHPHPLGTGAEWKITDDKRTSVEQSTKAMDAFTKLFLVLGTFTIIAGVTLIINIFVMLAEERKEEMGISRAVGMRRKHLRRLYLFEGSAYSIISSFVGVLFGVASGYAIIFGLQSILDSMGVSGFNILGYYTVTPVSLVLSFIAGFTITIATTLFITQRVARLNIVSAIRNTPETIKGSGIARRVQRALGVVDPRSGEGDGTLLARTVDFLFSSFTLLGVAQLLLGLLLMVSGIPAKVAWSTYLGLSITIIGLSLVIRHFVSQRITFNMAALLLLVLWIAPIPFFMDFKGDMEMFILSGIFMVTPGVMLLIWNTDIILWGVEKFLGLFKVSPAPVKMAISYPIKKRFRTGVTIFMFALIIFTITGMSMIIEIFNVNIISLEKSVGGGYDIIGVCMIEGIDDLEGTVGNLDPGNFSRIEWDESQSLSYGYVRINYTLPFFGGSSEMGYPLVGVSDKFVEGNTYGFSKVAWDLIDPSGSLDHDDDLVWSSLKGGRFVVLDANLAPTNFGSAGIGLEVGDNITIMDFNNTMYNRTVLGFTKQMGIQGIFMHEDDALSYFGISDKRVHLINVKDGEDVKDVSDGLRKNLLPFGFYSVIIHEITEQYLKAQNAFFDLFNAFLSLGLVIGIVGLGVVTLRSVYERRHEIGMMRAVGFKRNMVVGSFLGESGFIAGSGLFIGALLGIVLGWVLWRDNGFGMEFEKFGVPWEKILIICLLALFFALVSSIPPSFKASRVTPADALRYE